MIIVKKITRPIKDEDKILLLRVDEFRKIVENEKYVDVLANDSLSKDGGVSKSYYYYLVKKFRDLGLLEDNSLAFRYGFVFDPPLDGNSLKLYDDFIYVSKKGYLIIYDSAYCDSSCDECKYREVCTFAIKTIRDEHGLEIRSTTNREAWIEALNKIKEYIHKSGKCPRSMK